MLVWKNNVYKKKLLIYIYIYMCVYIYIYICICICLNIFGITVRSSVRAGCHVMSSRVKARWRKEGAHGQILTNSSLLSTQ